MKKSKLLIIALLLIFPFSLYLNAQTRLEMYEKVYEENPKGILIMPPINQTEEYFAKDFVYGSLNTTLIEKGYYVFPPILSLDFFEKDSNFSSEDLLNYSMKQLKDTFNCDAVLFTIITQWKKPTFIGPKAEVTIEYILKSAKTDRIIFNRTCQVIYTSSKRSWGTEGSLFAPIINLFTGRAIKTPTADLEAVFSGNERIFSDLPYGENHPDFLKDQDEKTEKQNIILTVYDIVIHHHY
ncbi:MAG: DUF799 domain-containing protein [Bacteroidales bacterium]|jgi:hypothetical protein|nr:DUF799 domain-containing protein [Bacteroidales bacterium]